MANYAGGFQPIVNGERKRFRVVPSRFCTRGRSRLLGRAGLLAGPAALALAGVAFAVAADPANDLSTRAWIEAPRPVHPHPNGNDDYRTLAEDSGAIIIPVLANDKDQDRNAENGNELQITAISDPEHGRSVVIEGSSGSSDQVSYTPDRDYCNDPSGRDDFRYQITNSLGARDVSRIRPRVTCVDDPPAAGAAAGGAAKSVADLARPLLSSGSLSSSFFRAARSGPSTSARTRVGTTVYFTLSEPARVRFRVQRKTRGRGRKVAGKCVKATEDNRSRRPLCNLWVTVRGAFAVTGKKGMNKTRFRGRIGGKTLKAGRYRLNSQATDPAGNKSNIDRRRFRIVK